MAHKDYYVIGIDVMGYSKKALQYQVSAQDILDRILASSIARYPPFRARHWLDGGDGGYLLLPNGTTHEVTNFLEDFFAKLNEENCQFISESKVFVRCAIHYDAIDIRQGLLGNKYTGNAINNCARLLNGMGRNPGQVVCSRVFRDKLVSFNDNRENITRLNDIVDKHGNHHEIYNLKRDALGIRPPEEELYLDLLKR